MGTKKTYSVTVKVPREFLGKLPSFGRPKLSLSFKKAGITSKFASPSPDNSSNLSSNHMVINSRINAGVKEMSTAGLTLNNVSNGYSTLDRSGKPTKRWVKRERVFKTFSGFKGRYMAYAVDSPSEA